MGREALAQIASVATPATLLRWYRCLIAANYDGSKNRSPGRPPTAKDIRELIVRVARENPTWGYTRLRGALKNLGHELGRNTIKRILAEHGIAPAPERGKSMSWSTFIKAHWGAIAATDLFTVEVVNPFGLVRYHVLFVIDIATRCVCIGGITSDPNGEWMKQVARNLTDKSMIELARHESIKAGIDARAEFITSAFLDFDSPEPFDLVVAMGYYDYLDDPLPHLEKMLSHCAGQLFVSFPKRWKIRVPYRKMRFWLERGFVRFYSKREVTGLDSLDRSYRR